MMQAIRTRAGSIVVKLLFGALILSFGLWGIYTRSPFSTSNSPDTVIATVGSQSIRADDLQRELQPALERLRTQFGGDVDQQQLKQLGIVDALLGQLVDRSLLDQEAERLGLDLPDAVIRSAIYDNPTFRGADGKFDRQLFTQVLMVNRLTEDQLVADLRRDIPRTELMHAIVSGATAPRSVVDVLYRYRNEKRVADIVAFPAASVGDAGKPDDAALEKYYEAHKNLFRAPEYRSFQIASLAPADLTEREPIPDDKLRQEYDQRKDEFGTPEQREIQQIIAPSEAKASDAEAALKDGKDWKAVATGLGQDPETIDLGLLSRKEIPHELGDVAFGLALNQPSQPINTPLGWHILRVVKIVPGSIETFAQAKPKLEQEVKLRDAVKRLDQIGNQADDALAGGAALADAAGKFGLKLATVAAVDANGNDRNGKPVTLPIASDDILKTAFSTNQGDTSRVTDAKDGAIFAVRVDKITPPEVRPLAEAKAAVVAAWQAEQQRATATKEAQALAAAATAESSLAKAAGAKGLTLQAAVSLSRSPQPDERVSPELAAKLFSAKPGAIVTVSDVTGAYVAQLKEIRSPKAVSDADAAKMSQQLDDEARADLGAEFTQSLRRRFPVEIKQAVLDRLF